MMYFRQLTFLLIIKALFMGAFIYIGFIGLHPDEAQYWTWSQALDWGYYSKPPGIAWQIAFGCSFAGDTELGVRLGSLLLGCLLPLFQFHLALSCGLSEKQAFWSALCFALAPMGFASSMIASTDGGFLLFWMLSWIVLVRTWATDHPPRYILIGVLVALGSLFKWKMYEIWIVIALCSLVFPRLRHGSLWKGVCISLLGFLPSVIWNWERGWPTFRHVYEHNMGGVGSSSFQWTGNPFEFLGAQAALYFPVFFLLLLFGFYKAIKHWNTLDTRLKLCVVHFACIGGFYTLASCVQKLQGNWAIHLAPVGFIFLAYGARWAWMSWGGLLSLSVTTLTFFLPFLQVNELLPLPYKINPFRHNLGWEGISPSLREAGYDPQVHFLFADKYQNASILSFYSEEQTRAYLLNLFQRRKNQFSYWPSLKEEQLGKTGYFVVIENAPGLHENPEGLVKMYIEKLSPFFEQVEHIRLAPLISFRGKMWKGMWIFRCERYNGEEPLPSNSY